MLFPTSGKLAGAAGCDTKACHGSWSSFICTYKHTYTNTHHRLHLHSLEALDPTPAHSGSVGLTLTHLIIHKCNIQYNHVHMLYTNTHVTRVSVFCVTHHQSPALPAPPLPSRHVTPSPYPSPSICVCTTAAVHYGFGKINKSTKQQ